MKKPFCQKKLIYNFVLIIYVRKAEIKDALIQKRPEIKKNKFFF